MTTPFHGFKHGEFARLVHSNPEQWYSLVLGQPIGKPMTEETMCQEILIHLGYSLLEIKNLHKCKFNIQKYMDSQTTGTTKKTSVAFPSTYSKYDRSISSNKHLSPSATSLLSYVPPCPLDSGHFDSVVSKAEKFTKVAPSTSTSTQQPLEQVKTPPTPQNIVDESANEQPNPKIDDCGGIFDFELDD